MFSGVVSIDGLFVLSVVVAQRASVALGGCKVTLDPFPIVLHGQVVLPLS